jgi:hypothetical protein
MIAKALKLGAALLVVPEADDAWRVKQSNASPSEKVEAYRLHAKSLRAWAETVAKFVPLNVR